MHSISCPARRLLAACLAAMWASSHAPADTQPVYTLQDCLLIGAERSLPLQNARREVDLAEAEIRRVRADALPRLDLNAGYTRLDSVPRYPGIDADLGREDNYRIGITAGQLLYSGGSVSAALRAARDYREFARLGLLHQQRKLAWAITRQFDDCLYAEAAIAVAGESVAQLESFAEQVRRRYEREAASEFDLLSAQVRLVNEQPVLIEARNRFALARAALRDLIYLDHDGFALSGSLETTTRTFAPEPLQRLALEHRADLGQAAMAVTMREANVSYAASDNWPELHAFGSYQGDNPGQEEPAANEWDWSWQAGLTLTWSLIDGGATRSRIAARRLELESARNDYEALARAIALEVTQAHLALDHARESVAAMTDAVGLARKALEIARTRYDQGLSTFIEFADANLALSRAALSRLHALRAYRQALADLRQACGGTLPGEEEPQP